jgi:hypothetical protein
VNYARDDVVTSRGSSWRALKASKGKAPGATSPSSATYWEALSVGLNPLGAWKSTATYQPNDIVIYLGSTWRAKVTNLNKTPGSSAANWEQFVAKGATGPTGAHGVNGTNGTNGTNGAQGAAGTNGTNGANGADGAQGPSGVVQTLVLNDAVNIIPGASSDFVFFGNKPTVTLDGNQRLTGMATLTIYSPNQTDFKQTLCYQPSDLSGSPSPFMGGFADYFTIANTYVLFTASASANPPAAGEYIVGYCVKNASNNQFNAGWVQGWVMVTNEQ